MDNDIGKHPIPPPLTFNDCFENGSLILSKYSHYRRRLDDLEQDTYELDDYIKKKRKRSIHKVPSTIKFQGKRSVKRHKILVRDKDGSLREVRPEDTLWYLLNF